MSSPVGSVSAPLTVALIGGEAAGRQAVKALLGRGVRLAFVCPSGSDGAALTTLAAEHGVPVVDAAGIVSGSLAVAVAELAVDILLNVHSLHILSEDLVRAPRIGSFNLHPGPLPTYGGLGAPSWAVFNGEARHGVTLHWMTAGIDAGDIAYEHWFDLGPSATGLNVSTRCAKHGLALVERLVDQATLDPAAIPRVPQGPGRRRLYRRSEIPFGGAVDWTQPASTLERFVRASSYRPFVSPWGTPEFVVDGRSAGLVAASIATVGEPASVAAPGTVVGIDGGGVAVMTGDGLLRIDRIDLDGQATEPSAVLTPGQRLRAATSRSGGADRCRVESQAPD